MKLAGNVSKLRYLQKSERTRRNVTTLLVHPHSAAYIGPQLRAITSGYVAGIGVAHLSQRFVAENKKRSQSRGGEHTQSSGTPGARKTMRGPSAKRRKGSSKAKKSTFRRSFRKDEEEMYT